MRKLRNVAVVLAGLNERRRELAILRSVGARPRDIFLLLSVEGLFVTLCGVVGGIALLAVTTMLLSPWARTHYGLAIEPRLLSASELQWAAAVVGTGLLAALIPAYRACRLSLGDGLTPRL